MSLGERLSQVRRRDCLNHLIRFGQSPEQAERWCEAWEREAELRGWLKTAEFWDHGRLWIDSQIAARRTPAAVALRR
jgi:hypothetical protein